RHAAQVALARERDERRGQSDRRNAEVDEREVPRAPVPAETAQQRDRGGLAEDDERDADRERDPQRLRREPRRPLLLSRARRARDRGRGPVGEEVEDRER